MTEYLKPSFTVKTSGRSPEGCEHGWTRKSRFGIQCVQCGELLPKWAYQEVSNIPGPPVTEEKVRAIIWRDFRKPPEGFSYDPRCLEKLTLK